MFALAMGAFRAPIAGRIPPHRFPPISERAFFPNPTVSKNR